jgi:mRNA interferase MazF
VYWVNLEPVVGTEIAKTRPGVIISNDLGNQYSRRVIVAAIGTRRSERVYPFEVAVPAGEGGLTRDSTVMLDQIRSVDKQRLGGLMGSLSADRMVEVSAAIRRSLAC